MSQHFIWKQSDACTQAEAEAILLPFRRPNLLPICLALLSVKVSPSKCPFTEDRPTGHVQSANHTHAYTHATCYMPHKWGPADRLESRLAGASSVSLRESWWEWRQCPPPPPRPRSGSAPPGPSWSPKEPGPKLPVLNLPAPRPPPAGWSRETPHWNKQIGSFQTCPFTLTVISSSKVTGNQLSSMTTDHLRGQIYLNQSEHKWCLKYNCWLRFHWYNAS